MTAKAGKWKGAPRTQHYFPAPITLVMVLLGLYYGVSALISWAAAVTRPLLWVETPCRIERFEIDAAPAKPVPFSPQISYHYVFEGKQYQAWHLGPYQDVTDDYSALGRAREKLAPQGVPAEGLAATCWVNRSEPEDSFLTGLNERPDGWGLQALGGLMIVSIAIALEAFRATQRRKPSEADSGRPHEILLGSLAATLLLSSGISAIAVSGMVDAGNAGGWPLTSARVMWSSVGRDFKGKPSLRILYRYEVDGHAYSSSRYRTLNFFAMDGSYMESAVRAHPGGSSMPVHVNPADPWSATVDPKVGWQWVWLLLSLIVPAASGTALWFMLRRRPA